MSTYYTSGATTTPSSFIAFPKELFSEKFSSMTLDAKMLYALMLDRVSLSIKNNRVDVLGHVYIIFKQSSIMELLHWSKNKVITIFKELEKFCLIDRKKQKANMPDLIYVKKISDNDKLDENNFTDNKAILNSTNEFEAAASNDIFLSKPKFENKTSCGCKNKPSQGLKIEPLNNTENNNTNISETSINPSIQLETDNSLSIESMSVKKRSMGYAKCKMTIKKQIGYDSIISNALSVYSKDLINSIVEIMTNVKMWPAGKTYINGCTMSNEVLQDYYMELNQFHIEYVLQSMEQRDDSEYIKNIRAYLATCLFNARTTLDCHIQHEIRHNKETHYRKNCLQKQQWYTQEDLSFLEE